MYNRLSRRLEQEHHAGVDLSPLLDVVFILLIFFIVTTVFVKETGVEVDKPKAVSSELLKRNVILFALTGSGEVIHDGASIGVSGVRATVAHHLVKEDRAVIVQVDKTASADLLVKVIDEARLAGASAVNVAAEPVR